MPPLPPGHRVELPGRGRTWVIESERRPGDTTVLLLHGLGATAALNWFTSFSALARRYHVVALDHRGHGRGMRALRFRLEDCADDAAALLDELGVKSAIAVGYSMGGPVAQLVWHRHPERVEGLVLCATSRNFRGGIDERMFFAAMPGVVMASRLVPPVLRRQILRGALAVRGEIPEGAQWALDEFSRSDPALVLDAARAVGQFSSHEWIGDVDVPTAVVLTTNDGVVPPHRQIKLAEAIPGASVHPIEADHGACVNAPRLFVPVLLEACGSVVRRARLVARR